MNYDQAIEYLESLQSTKIELGLERISAACRLLGNPEKKFPSVIVAGTNGKGSTCAFLESILQHHGLKVGLYISPHLVDVRERIQINRELISKEDFARMVESVYHSDPERSEGEESHETIRLTYFEFLAAMAFLYFAEQKVDIAVLEVGLGGRFDATNVVTPLVSAITRIDLDHQGYLGNTIAEIAYQKAGIIKKDIPAVTIDQSPDAMEVLRRVANENNSMLHVVSPNEVKWKLGLNGEHQYENAALAVRAVEIALPFVKGGLGWGRNSTSPTPSLQRRGDVADELVSTALASTKWPGRLEIVEIVGTRTLRVPGVRVILDGAHNPSGAKVLAKYIRDELINPPLSKRGRRGLGKPEIIILFGAMADKDIYGILKHLSGLADRWVLVRPRLERAASCESIAKQLELIEETKPVEIINDIGSAISQTISKMSEDSVLIITGSLYMVAEAKLFFQKVSDAFS